MLQPISAGSSGSDNQHAASEPAPEHNAAVAYIAAEASKHPADQQSPEQQPSRQPGPSAGRADGPSTRLLSRQAAAELPPVHALIFASSQLPATALPGSEELSEQPKLAVLPARVHLPDQRPDQAAVSQNASPEPLLLSEASSNGESTAYAPANVAVEDDAGQAEPVAAELPATASAADEELADSTELSPREADAAKPVPTAASEDGRLPADSGAVGTDETPKHPGLSAAEANQKQPGVEAQAAVETVAEPAAAGASASSPPEPVASELSSLSSPYSPASDQEDSGSEDASSESRDDGTRTAAQVQASADNAPRKPDALLHEAQEAGAVSPGQQGLPAQQAGGAPAQPAREQVRPRVRQARFSYTRREGVPEAGQQQELQQHRATARQQATGRGQESSQVGTALAHTPRLFFEITLTPKYGVTSAFKSVAC